MANTKELITEEDALTINARWADVAVSAVAIVHELEKTCPELNAVYSNKLRAMFRTFDGYERRWHQSIADAIMNGRD